MLKNLFKRDWQVADPEARCRAVQELAPAERELLAEIARTDVAAAVRATALGRIDDLDLLAERARSDDDTTVRARASERFRELLAGHVEGAPPLAERSQHVRPDSPVELLEYLAREAREPELRERSVAGVQRAALLGEIVLADPVAAVRHAALERLEDEPTLEQIRQHGGQNDKHVRRRSREKLAALQAARERPLAVAARCRELCALIDQLGEQGVFVGAEQRLQQIDREWQAVEPEYRQPNDATFAAARQRFEERLAAHHRQVAQNRSAREALMSGLEATLQGADTRQESTAPFLEAALRDALDAWQRAPALPAADAEDLQARFDTLCEAVRDAAGAARRERLLAELCAAGEALLARSGPLGEHEVKEWRHRLPAAEPDQPAAADGSLQQRVETLHAALRDRLREQVAEKDAMLGRLPGLLDELSKAVEEGDAKRALALDDEIGPLVADLNTIGVARERIGPLAARHKGLAQKVGVMRTWQRFGADQVRERLCSEVEALVGSERPPPEIATLLRAARTEWQGLSAGDPARAHKLRRRFEKAASLAYKPCKAWFDEQARAREANQNKQSELIARVDAFVAETDWNSVDWKAATRLRRDTATEWRQAGPVDRKKAKGLERRFRASLAALDERLQPERQRCLRVRERLIEQVEALQQAGDPRRAVDECKRLQREWQVTVPGPRREEAALWERFRAACDAVFGLRQRAADEQHEAWKQNLARRQALCEQAEATAQGEDIVEAQAGLARLQAEWREAGPVGKRDAAAVERRFAAAVERLAERRRADARRAQRDNLRLLRDKAGLCHAVETLAAGDDDALAGLQAQWAGLAPLADDADEQAMSERFEQACGVARADPESAARRARSEAENLDARQTLCLRMEILAGIESPPEHAAARMSYQVERLSSALGGRGASAGEDTVDGLLREWCLLGAAPAADAATLEARFGRAFEAGSGRGRD